MKTIKLNYNRYFHIDGRKELAIEFNGKTLLYVFDSKDKKSGSLDFNFSDCFNIKAIIELAYKIGLTGAKLEIVEQSFNIDEKGNVK